MNFNDDDDDESFPSSVEEAAALLGAAITRASSLTPVARAPPAGMHPAFCCLVDPRSDLIRSLYILRSLLRSVPEGTTLVSAPSVLQVLRKVLGLSTSMANASVTSASTAAAAASSTATNSKSNNKTTTTLSLHNKRETPPLLSTACRRVWVDCILLTCALDPSRQQSAPTWLRRVLVPILSLHPRSAKAAGGVRVAAFAVVHGLFRTLPAIVNGWSADVVPVCSKALKSAGQGEPTLRMLAMQTAVAVVQSSQGDAFLHKTMQQEVLRMVQRACTDKYPEVRWGAACCCAAAAATNSGLLHDPLWTLCLKNMDDESPLTATAWWDAAAQIVLAAMQVHALQSQQERERASHESDTTSSATSSGGPGDTAGSTGTATTPGAKAAASPKGSTSRKTPTPTTPALPLPWATSFPKAMEYIVDQFRSAGTHRCGGTYSTGGRAVRLGYAMILVRLLRHHGNNHGVEEVLPLILRMVVPMATGSMSTSRNNSTSGGVTTVAADMGWIKLYTGRVLRQGLSEVSPESVQVSLLHTLVDMLSSQQQQVGVEEQQVILVEISHLLVTVGEAAASDTSSIATTILQQCIAHENRHVRYEAAVTCSCALLQSSSSSSTQHLTDALDSLQQHYAALLAAVVQQQASSAAASATSAKTTTTAAEGALRLFRRSPSKASAAAADQQKSLRPHLAAIHGRSLLAALLLHKLESSRNSNTETTVLLDTILDVAATLVGTMTSTPALVQASHEAVFCCVRAGYCVIAGLLGSTSLVLTEPTVQRIFGCWRTAVDGFMRKEGDDTATPTLVPEAEMICVDAVMSSLVAFLQHRSDLLLVIPEALHHITVLLEDLFPLLQPTGRLGQLQSSPRYQSVMASLLEAFAWLPSGSFPLIADHVFTLATQQIEAAIEQNITCSILYSLVSKEDFLLDAKSLCRANAPGQAGGARDLEETILSLTADITSSSDLEAVMHLQSVSRRHGGNAGSMLGEHDEKLSDRGTGGRHKSCILQTFSNDNKSVMTEPPPTPLHEVGTWRKPIDPSSAPRVRTVDAAIQAFSAVFGLKDGKEQQGAMELLERLVPPFLSQLARTIGINTVSMDTERRAKVRVTECASTFVFSVCRSLVSAA